MSFQNLVLNNVRVLGYEHQNQFFGEKSFFYGSKKIISLQGYVLDLANTYGVKNILTDVINITKTAKNFQNIIINNAAFGKGKVTALSVDAGNWVKNTEYNITVEILSETPINDINLSNKKLHLLKSFSESLSIEYNNQEKILNGEHSIEIEYNADSENVDLIVLAKNLATSLLSTIPTSIAVGNYANLIRTNYTTLNTESYNTITGKASFRKTFSYNTQNNRDKSFSVSSTFSARQNQEGFVTATADYEVKAEYNIPSLYENVLAGINYVKSLNHLSNLASLVAKFSDIALNVNPISREASINKNAGTGTFSISFSNDPRKKQTNYISEYVLNVDRDTSSNSWTTSIDVDIEGIGQIGDAKKFENAEAGLTVLKNLVSGLVQNYYDSQVTDKSGSSLKILSKSFNKSIYQGKIGFNYTYTDDPTLIENDPDQITKLILQKSDTNIAPIIKEFLIPNKQYALLQNRNLQKQGSYQITISAQIGCSNNYNGKSIFNRLKSYINFQGLGFDYYLESIDYSSDEINKNANLTITYKYS